MKKLDRLVVVVLLILAMAFAYQQFSPQWRPFPWLEAGLEGAGAYNGEGIKAGVLDVFPMDRHVGLKAKSVGEWHKLRNIPDFRLSDDHVDHGTHVAGIIQRVVPKADIRMMSITIDPYDFKLLVQEDMDVINASAFMSGEWLVREIVEGLDRGMIFVMAAGNESRNLSYGGDIIRNILLRIEALKPERMHQIVLAVNLDRFEMWGQKRQRSWWSSMEAQRFKLHSSSNTPGPFYAHICLAAPGVRVQSDLANGKEGEMTGTSMAAPIVTGVIAKLMSAYDHMRGKSATTPEEKSHRARAVITALYRGAKKTQSNGAPLPADIFGQGVVDFEGSLNWLKRGVAW